MFRHCAKLFSGNLYGYAGVVNEAKLIYLVLLASKKIDKNIDDRLELLTSIVQPKRWHTTYLEVMIFIRGIESKIISPSECEYFS